MIKYYYYGLMKGIYKRCLFINNLKHLYKYMSLKSFVRQQVIMSYHTQTDLLTALNVLGPLFTKEELTEILYKGL